MNSTENQIALDMKFKELIPIADYLTDNQPITYLIFNLSTDMKQCMEPGFL